MSGARGFPGEDERGRLIKGVAELSMQRGCSGLELAQVAELAMVAPSRAEELFPGGLEECLIAAENAILLEVVSAISRSYSADRSEWESVIHGVKAVLELMAAHPEFAYLGYITARQMAPLTVREVHKMGERMLEAMLERGWEYSPRLHQPAKAALGVLGGGQALMRREVAAGRAERLPELLPDCVYIATVPFLGQGEALRLVQRARALAAAEAEG